MSNPTQAVAQPRRTIDIVNASLKRRYAAERRFRLFGLAAVLLGLGFVAMLLISIVGKGYTAFWQTYIELPIRFDAAVIDPSGELAAPDLDPAERMRLLARADLRKLARDALSAQFPTVSERREKRALQALLSPGVALQLRDIVLDDPSVIDQTRQVRLLANDDVDMFVKGHTTRLASAPGEGSLSPSGRDGEITLHSTEADFAPIRARARAYLADEAAATERELARIERRLTDADKDRAAELEQRMAATRGDLADVQTRLAADGAVRLADDMPTYLVAVNGGIVKLTAVGDTWATGDALVPLEQSDPGAGGSWALLTAALPQSDRRLDDRQLAWIHQLQERGLIDKRFNTLFFTNGTSREPELAGIAAALAGSFYTLALTLLLSFPIGVGAALYLEEFAPKNRWTDLIEVNINNLAAVPSIVFGLLGLAVLINFFGVPRSTPLVAAMVLTLMTLPTIIIASRAALKSVPPSIREAALGVGASPLQTQIHHVLPLAMPGMLTGTIIGMAQALGETAPLLMIGLIAFIVDVPNGIMDPATVLPVQIFMWADSPERGFVERTSAAIMVLLGFLVLMNLAAVLLRRRFERRW